MSEETSDPQKIDHPGVKIPPPLCYLAFLIIGIFVSSDWLNGNIGSLYQLIAGAVFVVAGLLILIPEALHHKKVGSNVEPWKPTTTIIDTGLYAYSRNPIYVGMTISYLGFTLASWSLAALLLLPLCLLIIRYHVIGREEAYLEGKFGDEYLDYKTRVRRWI
ncbi:MAG: isoprenylcysteine carboxylmethyltransferase family protein [Sneathiella sp.]|nr:isoprenylcysteine carboxylmethyltransferase family protein [Sneathiella sp.]